MRYSNEHVVKLEAEIKRLREALSNYSCGDDCMWITKDGTCDDFRAGEACGRIARTALNSIKKEGK